MTSEPSRDGDNIVMVNRIAIGNYGFVRLERTTTEFQLWKGKSAWVSFDAHVHEILIVNRFCLAFIWHQLSVHISDVLNSIICL